MQNFMPQAILDRKTKAEFSSMFRVHLDHMEELFTDELPEKRADWVTLDGMNRLYMDYQNDPQAGRQLWVLWSIFGCDSIFDRP